MKRQINSCKNAIIFSLILFLLGCDSAVSDWVKVQKSNSIEGYQNFLRDHPKSDYSNRAKNAIDSLEWIKASSSRDSIKLTEFITKNTNSKYIENAKELIWEIKPIIFKIENPSIDIKIKGIEKTNKAQMIITRFYFPDGQLKPDGNIEMPNYGNLFIIIKLEVMNRSNKEISINLDDIKVKSNSGEETSLYVLWKKPEESDKPLMWSNMFKLSPQVGGKNDYVLLGQVPLDANEIKLQIWNKNPFKVTIPNW